MKFAEYQLLSASKKEEIIWDHGRFLVTFEEGKEMFDVYEVFDFYVSISYELGVNRKAEIVAALKPDELPHVRKIINLF